MRATKIKLPEVVFCDTKSSNVIVMFFASFTLAVELFLKEASGFFYQIPPVAYGVSVFQYW